MERTARINNFGVIALTLVLAMAVSAVAGGGVLQGTPEQLPEEPGPRKVRHQCLTQQLGQSMFIPLDREHPWSLPRTAMAQDTTIHCLVLRYNFQFEDPDNPNTTGRGHMDLSPHPIPNQFNNATPQDSIDYLNEVGHFIDPPPHDSIYFDRHMRALDLYWEKMSEGKLHLTWDVYPPGRDSVYQLPQPMSFYGRCDFANVVAGLDTFFADCIHLADSAHIYDPAHPDIDFSQYQAVFVFHAGSDRQNDIGFPETCNDLFTGWIRRGVPVPVDDSTSFVPSGLMMPETASQDNRSTALNAVLAHEFGHQLGLVDLYRTDNFFTQLGDFALMDNNGFGTGVDFGWPAGRSFGTVPIYASAWSRAHLGFVDVVDFRQGSDVRLVAAAVVSQGIKMARVPISETEYYLIENRIQDVDGVVPGAQFDTLTNVIIGPARAEGSQIIQNGEYDFLMPGSGVLIFRVDEGVAAEDWDGDGLNNFFDNTLQNNPDRKFITLIEADGLVNFGGSYQAGFGRAEDMFRDDRQDHFTPNSNPQTIDHSGNNTRIYITDIRRAPDTTVPKQPLMDSVILFDVATDKLADNFPVRCGIPVVGLSPIVDDLDGDGEREVIVASNNLLSVFTPSGDDFLCDTCPVYLDTMITSINRRTNFAELEGYPVPLFYEAPTTITAGPVTGDFGANDGDRIVAVGYPRSDGSGEVVFLDNVDLNDDGRAEILSGNTFNEGPPILMSFGDRLWTLVQDTSTSAGLVYLQTTLTGAPLAAKDTLFEDLWVGASRIGNDWVLVGASDVNDPLQANTTLYYLTDSSRQSFAVDGALTLGPIAVDMDRNGIMDILLFSNDGIGARISVEGGSFAEIARVETDYVFTTNPAAGDLDDDGRPEVVIGGVNRVFAFNEEFILKSDFPREVDDGQPTEPVINTPVMSDIQDGGAPELIFSTQAGNVYAYGDELAYGFPINSGEQAFPFSNGSAVVYSSTAGGFMGYLGGDGWFYSWEVDNDQESSFWPMYGHDPEGSFALDTASLGPVTNNFARFSEEQFYNYPNPVVDGVTTIRYFLGESASSVRLTIFDLTGQEIASLVGSTTGGTDNEVVWDCGDVTPGVYRCRIEVDFGGAEETAFTDIAVIR